MTKYSTWRHVSPLLLLISFLLLTCNRPCKSWEKIPVENDVRSYFGFWKQGSYWIYQNKDKSRTDTLSVLSYSEAWNRDRVTCTETENIEVIVTSTNKVLVASDKVCYKVERNFIDFQACLNTFARINYSPSPSNPLTPNSLVLNDSIYGPGIQVVHGRDTIEYELYLKKHIGILGWATPKDTFNLTKYHITQ